MKMDPEAITVRTLKSGEFLIEDDDFNELFRIDPSVELPELLRQIVEIANKYHRIGEGVGARRITEDFKRLMSIHR